MMFAKFRKRKSEAKFEAFVNQISYTNPNILNYKDVKSVRFLGGKAHLFKYESLIKKNDFVEALKDIEVKYAESGEATKLTNSDNFQNFVENVVPIDNGKYVFHNMAKDERASKIIPTLIPIPKFIPAKSIDQMRVSRLFAGGKYSGTHIHIHSEALNYLVSGKKLWVIFPYTEKNNEFVERHNMKYGQIKGSALNWFLNSYDLLTKKDEIENLTIFIQNEGDVIYVPAGAHHAVVNLEDSIGITYSWV